MGKNENINILIVDDRPENLLVLESLLDNIECNIVKAGSGNEALSLTLDYDFSLIILDVQMPDIDGFETAELMRINSKTKYIPIIFVTAISKEQRCIFKGYEVGAVDYIFKPIEPIILQSKVKIFIDLYKQKKLLEEQAELLELKVKELMELREVNYKLESLSVHDGLTGISNRRAFNQYIETSWNKCLRETETLSLIMADIDYFKAYNDNYGHLQGDECLIKVAKRLVTSVKRPLDFVARYGGEEFAIILPETDIKDAMIVAENIRKDIESLGIMHEYSNISKNVTVSLGVAAVIPDNSHSIEELIENADKALYKSKADGRNKASF